MSYIQFMAEHEGEPRGEARPSMTADPRGTTASGATAPLGPVVTVGSVVINVIDYERMKEFWGSLLGSEVAHEIPPHFVWFAPQHEGGISVALQSVEHATEGTRRLHIDTSVPDVAAAKQQIIALGGAVVADHEMGGFAWSIMADPEGNEFCIAPAGTH
jgi:predicted enzyme related to lactoylglutathione lyase